MPELWDALDTAQQPREAPPDMWRAPMGVGSPAESAGAPSGMNNLAAGLYQYLGNLAKRSFGASEEMRGGGTYNPAPAVETALNVMGGGIGGTGERAGAALGSGPIRKAPALPMDEASRLARATEQGFTRDAYRGEGRPIEGSEFIQGHPARYDPGFLGGDAIYSTNTPRLANDYATLKAAREFDEGAPNVMPLKVKMENPLTITGDDKKRIAGMDRWDRDAWLRDDVYGKGHDGVVVKYGGGDPAKRSSSYEEYVAPATNYRSRFAAFDPANKDSGFLLGSGATDQKTAAAIQGIRAYHSSPHDFDKFDLSKIGTGEGAQVYGHGLYFAENPAVSGQGGQYWQQFVNKFDPTERRAAELLEKNKFDRDKALLQARKEARFGIGDDPFKGFYEPPDYKQVSKLLESGQPVGPRTYEVNINADPAHFLDWDKPLTHQPRKAMNVLFPEFNPSEYDLSDLHNIVRTEAATKDLAKAGIPGIKYLDQGSRGAGTGSSNYVVFDPKIIDIMKKYGIAGAAAAPPLAAGFGFPPAGNEQRM